MADEVAEYRYLETHKERVYMRLLRLDSGVEEKLLIPRKLALGSIEQNSTVRVRTSCIYKEGIPLKFIKSLVLVEPPIPSIVPIECLHISKELEQSQVSFRDSKNSRAFERLKPSKQSALLDTVDMDVLELELLDLSHFKTAKKQSKLMASSSSLKKAKSQKMETQMQKKQQAQTPGSKLYQDADLDLDYIEALLEESRRPFAVRHCEETNTSLHTMPPVPKSDENESLADLISEIEMKLERKIQEVPDNIDSLIFQANPNPVPDSASSTGFNPLSSSLPGSDGSNLSCTLAFGQAALSNPHSLPAASNPQQASERAIEASRRMDEEFRPAKLSSLVTPTANNSHKHVLKVRVSQVFPIKTVLSLKKDYFMCELQDESGSIPCVVEGRLVGERFLMFEQEAVLLIKKYWVRRGQKSKDKRMKDVELKLDDSSVVEEAVDDGSIPSMVGFNFVRLADLVDKKEGFTFDLACIAVGISKKVDCLLKSGGTAARQMFRVVDDSDFEGELTVWRDIRHSEKIQLFDLLVFRNIRVNNFRGKNLCNSPESSVIINPKHPDPRLSKLRRYREAFIADPSDRHQCLREVHMTDSQPQTLVRIQDAATLLEANPEVEAKIYSTIALIRCFKGNLTYSKCPSPDCYKGVVVDPLIPDLITCRDCGLLPQASEPVQRYIGSVELVDGTASIWCMYSKESVGRTLFGDCTAAEVYAIRMKDMNYFRSMLFQMANREMKFWIQPTYSKDKRMARMVIKYEIKRVEKWSPSLTRELVSSVLAEAARKVERIARKKEQAARRSLECLERVPEAVFDTDDPDNLFEDEFM